MTLPLAARIGRLFKSIGLLRKGHCVERDRSTLVGRFIGDAGALMHEAVKDAAKAAYARIREKNAASVAKGFLAAPFPGGPRDVAPYFSGY